MNKKKLLALVLAALMSVSGLTIAFADGTVPAGSTPAAAAMKSSGDAVTVTDAAGLAAHWRLAARLYWAEIFSWIPGMILASRKMSCWT